MGSWYSLWGRMATWIRLCDTIYSDRNSPQMSWVAPWLMNPKHNVNNVSRWDDTEQKEHVRSTVFWAQRKLTLSEFLGCLPRRLSNRLSLRMTGTWPCCACGCINIQLLSHHLFIPSLSLFVCVVYLSLSPSLSVRSFQAKRLAADGDMNGRLFVCLFVLNVRQSHKDNFFTAWLKLSCTCECPAPPRNKIK